MPTWQIDITYYCLTRSHNPRLILSIAYGDFPWTHMTRFWPLQSTCYLSAGNVAYLQSHIWLKFLAHLDDIIIFKYYAQNLRDVLERFRAHKFTPNLIDIWSFVKIVSFLEKPLSEESVKIAPKMIGTVWHWPILENKSELLTLWVFASYHLDYIVNFAEIISCPSPMMGSKVEFRWKEEHHHAFESLKRALISAPFLAYPSPNNPFILHVDASHIVIGAELSQVQGDKENVILYANNILLKDQKKWHTLVRSY